MKRILLASTAFAALAGAAVAQDFEVPAIQWSGSAILGYNDDIEDGLFTDVDVDLTATTELDNGWEFQLTYGFEFADAGDGGQTGKSDKDLETDNNLTITVSNPEYGRLAYGDVNYAPEDYWDGVTNMETDNFSEQDDEAVLRSDVFYQNFRMGVSGALNADQITGVTGTARHYDETDTLKGTAASDDDAHDVLQVGVGASYEGDNFAVTMAYQNRSDLEYVPEGNVYDDDYYVEETFGTSASFQVSGADVKVAYSRMVGVDEVAYVGSREGQSFGAEVSVPFQDFVATGFYVYNDATRLTSAGTREDLDDNYGLELVYNNDVIEVTAWFHDGEDEESGIEASYDTGTGLEVFAGVIDDPDGNDDGTYIGAEYDLGGGAELIVSYVDADDETDDEFGDPEYRNGTTAMMSFEF